jgi:ribosome-binding factor A
MSFEKSGVKDNYLKRIDADIYRILTLALRQKVGNENLLNESILRVETSADLSSARVYISGGQSDFEAVAGLFRNEIAQNMRIKRVPNLRFIVDLGEQNAQRVEELLKQIKGGK